MTFRKDYLLYNMKKFIMKWVTFMRLRELRNKKGLTLKQLGSIIGAAESTVSLYEKGKRQPDNETLIRIADYFGVTVDYLLGSSEVPAEEPERGQGQGVSAATQSAIVIKTLARLKGITLKQLTESAGIGRNTISRMVQGHMPGIDVLTKIAEQLDCPVEMLLDIDVDEPTPADRRVAEMTERMNEMSDSELEHFYAVFRALIGKPII